MKSRVHPKYKMRYRVTNCLDYERGLVERGDVTVWLSPEAVGAWKAKPSGRRSAQPRFSDLAIETALTLVLVFHLPRRAEVREGDSDTGHAGWPREEATPLPGPLRSAPRPCPSCHCGSGGVAYRAVPKGVRCAA